MDRNTESRGGPPALAAISRRKKIFPKFLHIWIPYLIGSGKRTPVWHHRFRCGQGVCSRNVIPDQNRKNRKNSALLLWLHFVKNYYVEIFIQIGFLGVLQLDNVSPLHLNRFFGQTWFLVNRGRSTTWSSSGKAIIFCHFLLFWLVVSAPPDVRHFNISTIFVLYLVEAIVRDARSELLNRSRFWGYPIDNFFQKILYSEKILEQVWDIQQIVPPLEISHRFWIDRHRVQ